MKKKITALCLAVAMLAVAVIGGTLAYFTDTDSAENVFTVGSIDIVLHEDNANGVADENYREWLKDQTIVPGVPVEKDAWVVNTGKNSAYVRVKVTVPANLNPVWASDLAQNWIIADTAKGTDATVYTLKYNRVLPAGGNTSDFLTAIVMDEYYNDQSKTAFNVIINVEAIQADGFADAAAAFSALDAQLKVNNGAEVAYVDNADALIEALESKKGVVLTGNVKIEPAKMSNAYGTTGINVKNGQMIDGKGNTLNIAGAGGTWDSGINTTGGVIKNITVTGSFRGIFINHNSDYSERVILENVVIDGTTYTISCDQGLNQGLTATNSTFNGWTSYAETLGEAEFINCSFGEGNGYAFCRPYAPTTFTNCEFETGFEVDVSEITGDEMLTFVNCTLNGVKLTDATIASLIGASASTDNVKVITFEEEQVVVEATNAADLKDALAAGKVVALTEDLVDAPVATIAPYGNLYGFHVTGGVFDGMGNTVDFEDAINNDGTNDNYGFMVSGGTIKNVSVLGAFRGIMIMSPTEDIVLDNVKVGGEGVCYAINTGEGDFTKNLTVTNSTIAGWTSLSNIKSASFTNCDFEQGGYYTNNVYGRVVKPYVNTVFENCDFTTAYNIDLSSLRADCKVTFINCTVNGQPLTADMFTLPQTDAEYENCTISVDLHPSRTLADCVIIK